MKIAIKFAYDGRKFNGYARQPRLRTIEGELIQTLIRNDIIKNTDESHFQSASRTDKGVSALGNVISFETIVQENKILQKINSEFQTIWAYGTKKVNEEFNPRYAKFRQYRYYLSIKNLNIDSMMDAATCFIGKHDFTNFAKIEANKNPIREIENIVFTKKDDILFIDFYAKNFLWKQIRRIMSALDKIGKSRLEKQQIDESLNNPNKSIDFGLAKAESLILKDVFYDFSFHHDENMLNKGKELEKQIAQALVSQLQ